jgi:hypothetical protein
MSEKPLQSFYAAGRRARSFGIANATGGGAGQAVTTAVQFVDRYGTGLLPAQYVVSVTASQSAFATVTNKSSNGFNVVLTPPSGVTLAAGTFDLVVIA